jgi:hypothetical protein
MTSLSLQASYGQVAEKLEAALCEPRFGPIERATDEDHEFCGRWGSDPGV